MSRNTLIGLVLMVVIVAGTLFWMHSRQRESTRRQKEITAILERTEYDLHGRIVALDSIAEAYPDDNVIQRVAGYQILRSHDELGSPQSTLIAAAGRFLTADSSGGAINYVASVYANHDIAGESGLRLARRALDEAYAVEKPGNLTPEQWSEQRRLMIGEAHYVRGKLQMLNAQLADARDSFEAAIDSVPDSPNFLRHLARLHREMGNQPAALTRYMDVVRLRYEDDEARDAIMALYPEIYGYRTSVAHMLDTLVTNARERRRIKLLAEKIEMPTPKFSLTGTDGAAYVADSLFGKVIVLNAWATWCTPCRKQLPNIQQAYERYRDRDDVLVLTVNFDENRERVAPYLERNGYTFPVAYGDESFYREIQLQGIPTTLFVAPDSVIRYRELGFSEIGDPVEEIGWRVDALLTVN